MPELRTGATRTVILIGKVAIKIPRLYSWRTFLNGLLANMQERQFWNAFRCEHLAKVYFSDQIGMILIMERADAICSKYDNTLLNFFRECEKLGLPIDPRPDNVGNFNGRKKLIDYGS